LKDEFFNGERKGKTNTRISAEKSKINNGNGKKKQVSFIQKKQADIGTT
jgi:hypothetical protein